MQGAEPELAPAAPKTARLRALFLKLLPFLSLGVSIVSAITMDRSEKSAPLVAAAAVASFAVLAFCTVLERAHATRAAAPSAVARAARFFSQTAAASLVQLALTFCGPFYVAAASFHYSRADARASTSIAQGAFLALWGVATAISLWDPLTNQLLARPVAGPAFCAFASFAALNVALPMLGVGHALALWSAAATSALALVVLVLFLSQERRHRAASCAYAVVFLLALAGGAARAIPPAPLSLTHAGLGTAVEARALVGSSKHFATRPSTLFCFTAIRAPLGLRDELIHEWRADGDLLQRVSLHVVGGRRQGFRTWSRLVVSRHVRGVVSCEVVTALGQSLGGARAQLDPAR